MLPVPPGPPEDRLAPEKRFEPRPPLAPKPVGKDDRPVGWAPNVLVELDEPAALKPGRLSCDGFELALVVDIGVVTVDEVLLLAFGTGRDSTSDAPKDDVGLNCFKPANPVIWGCIADTEIDGGFTLVVVVFVFVEVPKDKLEKASEKPDVEVIWVVSCGAVCESVEKKLVPVG